MCRWMCRVAVVLMSSASTWAQEARLPDAPLSTDPERSTAFQWLMVAVFLIACLVVAFKPAKRSKLE